MWEGQLAEGGADDEGGGESEEEPWVWPRYRSDSESISESLPSHSESCFELIRVAGGPGLSESFFKFVRIETRASRPSPSLPVQSETCPSLTEFYPSLVRVFFRSLICLSPSFYRYMPAVQGPHDVDRILLRREIMVTRPHTGTPTRIVRTGSSSSSCPTQLATRLVRFGSSDSDRPTRIVRLGSS